MAVASTKDFESTTSDGHALRVEFVVGNDIDKQCFHQLENQKTGIESEFGGPLVWAECPGKKQSKMFVKKSVDLDDRDQWPAYHEWLLKNLEKFHAIFGKRVKDLVLVSASESDSASDE